MKTKDIEPGVVHVVTTNGQMDGYSPYLAVPLSRDTFQVLYRGCGPGGVFVPAPGRKHREPPGATGLLVLTDLHSPPADGEPRLLAASEGVTADDAVAGCPAPEGYFRVLPSRRFAGTFADYEAARKQRAERGAAEAERRATEAQQAKELAAQIRALTDALGLGGKEWEPGRFAAGRVALSPPTVVEVLRRLAAAEGIKP